MLLLAAQVLSVQIANARVIAFRRLQRGFRFDQFTFDASLQSRHLNEKPKEHKSREPHRGLDLYTNARSGYYLIPRFAHSAWIAEFPSQAAFMEERNCVDAR